MNPPRFRPSISRCILILGIAVSSAAGQRSDFTGRSVISVEYVPANVLHPADLERIGTLKPNDTYRPEKIADAIDRLFATGLFEDIAVDAQPSGSGVAIRFLTEPTRFVSGLSVNGGIHQPPNRGELTSATQIQLGARFRPEDVTDGVKRIHDLDRKSVV